MTEGEARGPVALCLLDIRKSAYHGGLRPRACGPTYGGQGLALYPGLTLAGRQPVPQARDHRCHATRRQHAGAFFRAVTCSEKFRDFGRPYVPVRVTNSWGMNSWSPPCTWRAHAPTLKRGTEPPLRPNLDERRERRVRGSFRNPPGDKVAWATIPLSR